LAEACARFAGLSKLTPDEMRLASYPDSMPEIDVCGLITPNHGVLDTFASQAQPRQYGCYHCRLGRGSARCAYRKLNPNIMMVQSAQDRSIGLKASLRGAPRRSTLICCLNTKISASSAARDRKRSVNIRQISLHRSNITRQHHLILDQLPARHGLR
jgi:hypothetical protein